MSSLASPASGRLWLDRKAERKSGNYAAMMTLGLLLAANAALLMPRSMGTAVPLGDTPLIVELRRLPPSPLPVVEPKPETRMPERRILVSEMPEPERLVVSEPPAPPKVEEKPRPKPVKKVEKSRPEKRRETSPAPMLAEVSSVSQTAETATQAGRTFGHASGAPEVKPDNRGAVLAALLHAVEANKDYPRQARRAGMEGKTVLKVSIGADGRVASCVLAEASGKTILDSATEKLGQILIGMDIPPARGKSISVLIPVRYSLKRS